MGAAQAIAGTLGSLVTAVTTQLSGYFSDQNRLQREFVIPAVGFLLGLLALVFIVLGPDVPRAWWDTLPGDIRVLVGALAAVSVVLLAEVSRLLMTTVRRLYAGELGVGLWWRQRLRQRYLDAWDAQRQHATDLEQVQGRLTEAKHALDGLWDRPTIDATPQARQILVPRLDLPAYRWITFADLTLAEGEPAAGMATAAQDLVGRYAREPLPAGGPVSASLLGPRVREAHLGVDRRLVLVRVARPDAIAHIHPGDVVSVCTAPASAAWAVSQIDDVLVADRLGVNEVLLSVPHTQVTPLLSWAAHGNIALVHASASQPCLIALPVVKADFRPGERITRDHLSWDVVDASLLTNPPRQATHEEQVLGKIYWPREVGLTLDPTLSDVTPLIGGPFELSDLADGPKTGWLGPQGDLDGRPRRGYRLPLPGPGQKTAWPAHERPCRAGDVLTVAFELAPGADPTLQTGEHGCYVYEVRDGWCAIAVRDPAEFHRSVLAAATIRLTALMGVTLLREAHQSGRLVDASQVVMEQRRAAEVDPRIFCLSPDEVIDHFADLRTAAALQPMPTDLPAHEPIRRELIGAAFPSDWIAWTIRPAAGLPPLQQRITGVDLAALVRGDLLDVELLHQAGGSWSRGFVREVTRAANGDVIALTVMGPPEMVAIAEALWVAGAELRLHALANDPQVVDARRAVSERIALLQESGHMSRVFSRDRADIQQIRALAGNIDSLVTALATLKALLVLRPWQGEPATAGYTFEDVWAECWHMIGEAEPLLDRWQDLLARYQLRTEQAAQLAIPDSVGEIRPTRLGNVLAAADGYPFTAYGIDTATILPRLLQVIDRDDPVLARLVGAESALNMLLMFSFWSGIWTAAQFAVLFVAALLSGQGTLALPLLTAAGALLWWITKNAAVDQGIAYGESLKALFDLRRHALLREMALDTDGVGMTHDEEATRWRSLYRLFATGDASGLPATRSLERPKVQPAAGSSGA